MNSDEVGTLDWDKVDGLIPAIVQDAVSGRVLMLGYMNQEALRRTLEEREVTFFSRIRKTLWTKGETSGHRLDVVAVTPDCDGDTLLVLARPRGPTCHNGSQSCFGDISDTTPAADRYAFLARLDAVIAARIAARPEGSYTARLYSEGPTRMAQKVGEEAVEVAIAAVGEDRKALLGEAADLLYHLMLLLKGRDLSLSAVISELAHRHIAKS